MEVEEDSKSHKVKLLALDGKFNEIEETFGSKAKAKGVEYAKKKLSGCRSANESDLKYENAPFIKFALTCSTEMSFKEIMWNFRVESECNFSEPEEKIKTAFCTANGKEMYVKASSKVKTLALLDGAQSDETEVDTVITSINNQPINEFATPIRDTAPLDIMPLSATKLKLSPQVNSRKKKKLNHCKDGFVDISKLTDNEFEKLSSGKRKKSKQKAIKLFETATEPQYGVAQKDLPQCVDLLNMISKPRLPVTVGIDPIISGAAYNKPHLFVIPLYREFLSQLSADVRNSVVNNVDDICSLTEATVTVSVLKSTKLVNYEGLSILQVKLNSKSYNIVYASQSSAFLSTDRYVIESSEATMSFSKPYLFEGGPVRKMFANEYGQLIWVEGCIYAIKEDYKISPYNSISVLWLEQEEDTNKWVYEYTQEDNLCSPWDLSLSGFYLEEKLSRPVFPRAVRGGSSGAAAIIKYLSSLDYSEYFRVSTSYDEHYQAMFPNPDDRVDLLLAQKWCNEGRYSDGDGVGISLLFADMRKMIRNSKILNEKWALLLPYRLADAFENVVDRLEAFVLSAPSTSSTKSRPRSKHVVARVEHNNEALSDDDALSNADTEEYHIDQGQSFEV